MIVTDQLTPTKRYKMSKIWDVIKEIFADVPEYVEPEEVKKQPQTELTYEQRERLDEKRYEASKHGMMLKVWEILNSLYFYGDGQAMIDYLGNQLGAKYTPNLGDSTPPVFDCIGLEIVGYGCDYLDCHINLKDDEYDLEVWSATVQGKYECHYCDWLDDTYHNRNGWYSQKWVDGPWIECVENKIDRILDVINNAPEDIIPNREQHFIDFYQGKKCEA